jgi:glycosyltransferase involved in cell wall biosynthesis
MQSLHDEISGANVVHLHSAFLWPTWRAARLSRKSRIPYVMSPRGMLVKKLIASRNRLIKSAWIALIERSSLERAAAIHATSAIEAEEIQKFGWRLPRIVVVPNGVDAIGQDTRQETREDTRQDAPAADIAALAGRQPLVLFFGRLAQVKGLDRLLRAFARTRRGTLAIVGNDYEGLAAALSEMARQLKIDDRVSIVPRTITDAEKECMFAAARVFVLPSYSESFGNVVLEAMQRGLPVIVTPEVGAAEVVKESGGGLVASGDAQSLGAAIDRLTEDAARSAAMGEAGRRHVSGRYGWPGVAARMEALYDELKAAQ